MVLGCKLSGKYVASILPKRPKTAHKGDFGKVLVIAGSENYPGAAYLACAACLRVGAGLVTLMAETEVKELVFKKLPEATYLNFFQLERINDYNVLLLGPGLGQGQRMKDLVRRITGKKLLPVVVDADGLNILSGIENWWKKLPAEAILTPHLGEMARLTGLAIEKIQTNRIKIASDFAKLWNKVVVLKGANTIVVSPAGEVVLSSFANPSLSTAGTGDILSGMIAGFLAQGLNSFNASCCGVFIHGLAGEIASKQIGKAGVIASDLLPLLPKAIRQLSI